jgi:PAS domain S-box-containing protein
MPAERGLWASIAPHLTSWQETLEALAQNLPRFVDAAWIDVYVLDDIGTPAGRALLLAVSAHATPQTRSEIAGNQPCAVGEGVCGVAIQTGQTILVPDVTRETRYTDIERSRGRSLLAVPLLPAGSRRSARAAEAPPAGTLVTGEPTTTDPRRPDPGRSDPGRRRTGIGVLCAARDRVGAFSPEDVDQIESIAGEVAALLDYARQYSRLLESAREAERRAERQTQELRIERDRADFLHHVAEEMTRTLDLDRVLNRTLARVGRALGVRQGSILLLDPASGYLVYRAALGRPIRLPQGGKRTRYKRGVGLGGWVLEHNQWTISARLDQDPRWVTDSDTTQVQGGESQSALALPLSSEGEAVGVLLLYHPEPDYFGEQHVALATSAANHITVAVKNAEMYRLIREQAERLGCMLREQRRIASQHVAILSSIADGLVVADDRDNIVVANDAAHRILSAAKAGIPADELVGQSAMALFGSCPEDAQQTVRQAMREVAAERQGAPRDEPASATLKCGDRIVKASFTPMLDDRQQFAGTVIVLRDITVEHELAQAKSEFVSIVSHELRTPMTSIKGYTDLMLKGAAGELNEQQIRFLATVKSNIDRMADLVQDLLDISRIEAGRVRLSLEALDMRQVVFEVSDTVAEAVRKQGLTLDTNVDPALPVVRADKGRVIQVLLNLVSNAYRYTPAGGKITVSVYPVDGAIQVDVTDTGIGIPEEEQEAIFERFYRADHPVVRQQTGTGLGLPIARSLIEMHKGKLWLQSQVDRGSTFSFTLPLAEAL